MRAFAGFLILVLVLILVRWVVTRARKGYGQVQTLMAQVEAHSSANSLSAAQSNVSVSVGGDSAYVLLLERRVVALEEVVGHLTMTAHDVLTIIERADRVEVDRDAGGV